MTKDKSILIKNIYYMLAYAYQNIQYKVERKLATESFENVHDLFAAILAISIMAELNILCPR